MFDNIYIPMFSFSDNLFYCDQPSDLWIESIYSY